MAMGAGFSGRSGLLLLGALALGLIGGGVWYAGRGPEPGATLVPAAPGSQTGAQTPQTQPAAQVETPAPETTAAATPPVNDTAEAEPPAEVAVCKGRENQRRAVRRVHLSRFCRFAHWHRETRGQRAVRGKAVDLAAVDSGDPVGP